MQIKILMIVLMLGAGAAQASERWYKPEHVSAGEPLYQTHCASCHGTQAQGAFNWQKRGSDGRFPPPPLNGTAHTWHHPLANLYRTIMRGQNNMPAHQDKLSKGEVLAILAWLQNHWPDEIYAAWARLPSQ